MIFPTWQPLYSSSHKLAEKCGKMLGEKVTHTGTLDPMASGVLVLLTGQDRLVKGSLHWQKTYQFSIIWNLQTDSFDQLGLITDIQQLEIGLGKDTLALIVKIKCAISQFPTSYNQVTPAFSARRSNGVSSFDRAKLGESSLQKNRLVELSQLQYLGYTIISSLDLLQQHENAVSQVVGDFRQNEIINNWQKTISSNKQFLITHHQVITSPGTYVRQLVQDLAKELQLPATTWQIIRTVNGPFEKQDCVKLDELSQMSAS
jgi:tRNA pseudouridine55 synthase